MSDRIRRGQLIAPFGPGAITVVKGGTQLICAGLDHWFQREDEADPDKDVLRDEFRVDEPRLERALGVRNLYQPPDYRRPSRTTGRLNAQLSIPFLRFPLWHVCSYCRRMDRLTPTASGRMFCETCKTGGKKRRLVQVRFAAMCDRGHLQDFPWREWVHERVSSACSQPMEINASGASLASIRVECQCGKTRTLGGIMDASSETGTTRLSTSLDPSEPYLCRGERPWLGEGGSEPCASHVRGTLLNATNIYFAPTASAVYLPPEETPSAPPDLLDIIAVPPISTLISLSAAANQPLAPDVVRNMSGARLSRFTNEQIAAAIATQVAFGRPPPGPPPSAGSVPFRLEEYRVLQRARDRDELRIKIVPADAYASVNGNPLAHYFGAVSLVERLRETRAFTGFGRVAADKIRPLHERKALLWADPSRTDEWLPAYVVYGEGLFLTIREDRIQEWLSRTDRGLPLADDRVAPLIPRFRQAPQATGNDAGMSPKLLLLHTLAHLLINRLTFECGYSSASLRERLYASTDPKEPMSGILIYTASGDSEGTMGGLVRMGKPGRLEPLIARAIENARWCSADPVCMEMAEHGQGPDSCNLAACHACALVPETSCELFNRFLDRGVVVGTPDAPSLGYFG